MTLYKGEHSLFRALAPKYRLNKAEFIQIYNLRPTTQVMLELIIEEVRPCPLFLPNPYPLLARYSSHDGARDEGAQCGGDGENPVDWQTS